MPYRKLDRSKLLLLPLFERYNRVRIEEAAIRPGDADAGTGTGTGGGEPAEVPSEDDLFRTAEAIRNAKRQGSPVVVAFGAHTVKNGLAPVLIDLLRRGWIDHLATNGAGIIHDWEFAYLGETSEKVEENVRAGTFGLWHETGYFLNLALAVGAYRGLGYGESVGMMITEEGLDLPEPELLEETARNGTADYEIRAAALDLLDVMKRTGTEPGRLPIPHPYKSYSLQSAAYELKVPFTGHPMIGHDIIYTHPANDCAAVGRTAGRDLLTFAEAISRIDRGVYLSIGSAIMSPMIFEKSMAMAQNLALQEGKSITDHTIIVVDLMKSKWDWTQGEPPEDSSAYYLRFLKSFARMGGTMRYISADNRSFLARLHDILTRESPEV